MDYEGQTWQGSDYPLSLNISGLTVASPTNLSPINRPASPGSAHSGRPFGLRISTSTTSLSSSSNSASAPPSRKRSFTSNPPTLPTLTTTASDDADFIPEDTPMDLRGSITPGGGASPVDGGSGGSGEEGHPNRQIQPNSNMAASMGLLGKPMPTNNFVTKLYQMINDPKSAHFINWTELGTSFVVSNVGEFSRSILGSHFKHNNFSSFVRQLNMYGFHKINRTPRAQRTSTDAQTWEFSHHKFLRGRPDLLDEIKRKALEPDPAVKQRVELPGEVAAQLGAMREENRRVWEQLAAERRKVEKLAGMLNRLWDVVGKAWPGSVPPFPSDLLESVSDSNSNSPNIYVTSPTSATPASRFPPPNLLSVAGAGAAGGGGGYTNLTTAMGVGSPQSSPTAPEFGAHIHHSLHAGHGGHPHQQPQQQMSRQHSHTHSYGVGYSGGSASRSGSPNGHGPGTGQGGDMGMDLFDEMSPVVPSGSGPAGGSSSATSSSTSVNLTGMGSAGSGSGPNSSSSVAGGAGGSGGVTAEQGDGPGDGPGAPPITGRGSTKRQRMSISSGSNEDVLMNGHGGYMMTSAASASSDSLLSPAGHHSPHQHNHAHTHAHHAHHSMNLSMGGMGGMGGLTVPGSGSDAGGANTNPTKRLSTTRARSDSAPLYHHPQHMHSGSGSPSHPGNNTGSPGGWGRPRSGSGMMPMHGPGQGQRDAYGNMPRGVTVPSISMPRAGLVGGGAVGVGMGGAGLGMPTVPSNAQGQQGR